jgi:hypothetical protein
MMFATVAQTKRMLRIDDADAFSDADFEALIETASEAVLAYLKNPEFINAAGVVVMDLLGSPPIIPVRVVHATVTLVGYLYRTVDADPDKEWAQGYLPFAVTAILYPLRDPAMG